MTVEVAIMAAIMAGFIGFFFMFIRFWIEQGARRLQRKIRDALDIKSVGAAVAEVTVVESSLPWEPTEEERLAYEKRDHDRYRAQKLEWHNERLAQWDVDFEQALPLEEREILLAERAIQAGLKYKQPEMHGDDTIMAWGGMKIYDARPVQPMIQPPYLTVNEMRAIRSQELSQVERLEAEYKAQMDFLLTYGSFDSYDSDGDQE
jgi:hypothetical protein